jgi:hypothetical protein
MNDLFENFVNDHRAEFDDKAPNNAILKKILDEMKPSKIIYFTRFKLMAAASIIAIIIGAFIIDKLTILKTNTITKNTAPSISNPTNKIPDLIIPKSPLPITAIIAVKTNINKMKLQLFHLLSNDLSASERFKGATNAYQLKNPDKDIIDVLVKIMDNDPNSNVRLAALDALGKFYREPYVKAKLVKSLQKQKDPIVQIALIELLTSIKEASIISELQKISTDVNNIKAVKDQAYSGLQKLSL